MQLAEYKILLTTQKYEIKKQVLKKHFIAC